MSGWTCAKCGRSFAPSVRECEPCNKNVPDVTVTPPVYPVPWYPAPLVPTYPNTYPLPWWQVYLDTGTYTTTYLCGDLVVGHGQA